MKINNLFIGCENMFGELPVSIQKRVKKFIVNPSVENWDDIFSIIISNKGRVNTIWQAIVAEDPSFPRSGRVYDAADNVIKEWARIPDVFLLVRAIENAKNA